MYNNIQYLSACIPLHLAHLLSVSILAILSKTHKKNKRDLSDTQITIGISKRKLSLRIFRLHMKFKEQLFVV